MDKQILEEALNKKAVYGNDIDLKSFDDNDDAHVQSLDELTGTGKEKLERVGIDLKEENRSATFVQVDNAAVESKVQEQTPLELMNTGVAAKKYPELVKNTGGRPLSPIRINTRPLRH